jgi:acetyl esterase/lipase
VISGLSIEGPQLKTQGYHSREAWTDWSLYRILLRVRFNDLWQSAGLLLMNSLAHSVPYKRDTVAYGDHDRNQLDWYRLSATSGARPTVLFFYGGNWRSGRREQYRFVADTLLQAGYDVIVPDYRLYPDVRFTEILEDAQGAARVALEILPDDAPVYLMGHSSGAQLASLLTLNMSLLEAHHRISGFVGLAGPYDFFPFSEDDHWDLFAPEPSYPKSQPVNFVRADGPPLYLLHGEEDRRVRRGHSKSLMEKQQAAGGKAAREVYPDIGHIDIIVEFSRYHRRKSRVISDIVNFLDRGLPTETEGEQ